MEMTNDVNALPIEGEGGLIDLLKTIVNPRKPRGVRHPVVTITAIAVLAALSGARSFQAIADWAKGLSREALRKLGSKRRKPPSEPTIRRVLQGAECRGGRCENGNMGCESASLSRPEHRH